MIEDGSARSAASCATSRAGDQVVCGVEGIRVVPEFQERDRLGFAFMTNEISSERRVEVGRRPHCRDDARRQEARGGRIAFVAGPVVVHTGGGAHFCDLIRAGYVDVLLAGNALAVHDVEHALFGTSLGVDLETGRAIRRRPPPSHARHQHDLPRRRPARRRSTQGVLTSGVMYECIRHDVDVRAGGQHPRRRTVARHDHGSASRRRISTPTRCRDVKLVLVLSTMLHGIGVGNMLPAWVRMVCVDINPAVVTKLADRGSSRRSAS